MDHTNFEIDNMYCGLIRRGDIFIYEDKKGKKETVVVIQDDILNESLPTVVCAHIEEYKKGRSIFANEVFLPIDETGFPTDTLCVLYTLEALDRRGMVIKKGELTADRLQMVLKALDINCGRFRDRYIDLEGDFKNES
ncbi:MAG: type II toxin-antitoxin system PemK/MazF family toxin [Candidatus Magasanikbacteria bacterium]